jgi:hypothetical protein
VSNIDDTAVASVWDNNAAAWTTHVWEGRDLYKEIFNNPSFLEFARLSGGQVIDLAQEADRN